MEVLANYDPDEKPRLKVVKPEELRAGDKCPTCKQPIEKKVARDDINKVIMVYKMATGYEKDDRGWDRVYFARYVKSAKQLIEFLGSWEQAADAIEEISEKMKEIGRTFTFETIVTHSAEWKKNYQEKHPVIG